MTYGRIAWIALVSAAVVVRGEEPATPHLTTTQATSTPTTSAPTTSASASASAPAATTSPATAAPAPDAPAASLEQATGRFEAALRKAREQYLRDLTELKRRAIRAENLAAANELNALIEQLDGGAGAGGPGGPGVRLNRVTRAVVRADQDWQRTNILLRAGETIRVTASGEWVTNDREPALTTYGPDGLRRDGTADFHGMWSILWARIGYKVYFVGRGAQITAEQDGPLEFRSNDFSLGDNRGALTVQITKE